MQGNGGAWGHARKPHLQLFSVCCTRHIGGRCQAASSSLKPSQPLSHHKSTSCQPLLHLLQEMYAASLDEAPFRVML